MRCKRCHSVLRDHDISPDYVVECWKCGAIYELEAREKKELQKTEPLPRGFDILELRSNLQIDFKWTRARNRFIEFFTLMWNGILGFMVLVILATGAFSMLAFLSLHILVGLGFLYFVLGTWFNKTRLSIDGDRLTIKHGPLRWPFDKKIDISARDVDQLYCRKYVMYTSNNVPQYGFQVVAQLSNFQELVLIKRLPHISQALFLEQRIERFLGIENKPVDGEVATG